jgi:hypothetical protein
MSCGAVDHEERDQNEDNAAWNPESNNVPEGSMYMQGDHPIAYDRSYLFDHPGLLAGTLTMMIAIAFMSALCWSLCSISVIISRK